MTYVWKWIDGRRVGGARIVDARATRTPGLSSNLASRCPSMHATAHAASFASRRGGAMGSRVRARAPSRARSPLAARRPARRRGGLPKPDKIDKTDNYRQGAGSKFKVRDASAPPHRPGREPSALPARGVENAGRDGDAVPGRPPHISKFRPPPRRPRPPPHSPHLPNEPEQDLNGMGKKKKVVIVGGGLSGLACAKYLADAATSRSSSRRHVGREGVRVAGRDGDWIETGFTSSSARTRT